jgi:hypothetical protein
MKSREPSRVMTASRDVRSGAHVSRGPPGTGNTPMRENETGTRDQRILAACLFPVSIARQGSRHSEPTLGSQRHVPPFSVDEKSEFVGDDRVDPQQRQARGNR